MCLRVKLSGFLFSIFLLMANPALAVTKCERDLMNIYLEYRSALLDADFNSKTIMSLLRSDIEKSIKHEEFKSYLVELRVKESKIIKLYEYAGQCGDIGLLKIKILFLNGEYNRLKVFIKKQNNKLIVDSTVFSTEGETFDRDQKYEPVVLGPRSPAALKND